MITNTGQAAPQYALSQQQQEQATSMGRVLPPQNLQQASISLMPRIDSLIKTLSDACQRDDLRLKALQEISNSFEEVSVTNAYHSLISNLLTAFMKIFQDTVPQFISENNTQQLRKLMLEIILRMACNETVKQFAKTIQPQLVETIISENEENALIAMKIMAEYMRGFRLPFCQEVSRLLSHFKSMYQNMPHHVSARRMFEQRSQINHTGTTTNSEESIIESSLQCCYTHTIIYLPESNPDGTQPSGYALIPRALQSIKVLAEIPTFLLTLCQLHRHNVKNELTEFVPLIIQFVNLSIPADQRASQIFSMSLAEEFYNSQVRALNFLGIMAKTTAFNMTEVMNRHSASLIQGIVQLMERCPNDTLSMRRELIATAKNFFQCDMRTKFISILPRLFNENLLLGTGFTVVDNMSSVYTFVRSIHDQSLPPYVQAMCCKLVMNLIDSFVVIEKEHSEQPGRDILLWIMESYVRKFRVLAEYHVPMLIAKDAANISDIRSKADEKLLRSGNVKSDERSRKLLSDSIGRGVDLLKEISLSNIGTVVGELEPDEASDAEALKESVVENGPGVTNNAINLAVKNCHAMLPPPTKVGKFSTPNEILTRYWALSAPPMTFHDANSILRVLAQACKQTVHGLNKTHITNLSSSSIHEAKLMEQLFFYGLKCLDIYILSPLYPGVFVSSPGVQRPGFNGYRSKDEKEVLECFAGIFTALNPTMFKEIFSKFVEYFIQRISRNPSLYLICNAFLVAPSTSAKCADVLIRYLMKKLPELSENNDVTSLYLKLFKLVFSSISCCQPSGSGCAEVEKMLQPYLHDMVYESMELALRGREPANYLHLLRGLFRSIGGGNYDLLYQAFLPLLPTLLQQINRLQSSAHRQQMKEIFVELCLTVPVRLSALLPFLPLLMDPLVCALNGSPPIVSQGLRTLELCVNNLQPEYLYEHMTPVRAQLMHGLWRAVSSGDPGAHPRAFKILCKFGGSNRKMLSDSQELNYSTNLTSDYPAFELVFLRTLPTAIAPDDPLFQDGGSDPLHCVLSIRELVSSALENLRSPFALDPSVALCASPMQPSMRISPNLRRHSYIIIRSVIFGSLMPSNPGILENLHLRKHLISELEAVRNDSSFYSHTPFKCTSSESRLLYIDAFRGLFYAVVSRDLRDEVMEFFKSVIRQLTIQAVFDYHAGSHEVSKMDLLECMDGFVIVDVLMKIFADPCKEISQAAIQALALMRDTLTVLFGDEQKALEAPVFCEVFYQSLSLCYTDAWYARLGGCSAINYFLTSGSKRMIVESAHDILSALFEVIIGLSDEVSSSAVDMSVNAMDKLVEICFEDKISSDERRTMANIFIELAIKHLAAPSPVLRLECRKLLSKLSVLLEVTLNELLQTHKGTIEESMQSGFADFVRMSLFHQSAFLESFEHIYSMEPPLLKLSFSDSNELKFINELIFICETDDSVLLKKNNYQPSRFVEVSALGGISDASLIQFREITIRAALTCYIASCNAATCLPQAMDTDMKTSPSATVSVIGEGDTDISDFEKDLNATQNSDLSALQTRLFSTILSFIKNPNPKLQRTAYESLKNSELKVPLRIDLIRDQVSPIMVGIGDGVYRPISSHVASQLQYYMRLSFEAFDEDFVEKLETHLRSKPAFTQGVTLSDVESMLKICEILAETPTVGSQFIEILTFMFSRWESLLVFDTTVNWRYPLFKYLIRFPLETVRFFVLEECISDEGIRELFKEIVNCKKAEAIREVLMNDNLYFFHLLHGETARRDGSWCKSSLHLCDMELLALKLIESVGRRHMNWAARESVTIVKRIQALWTDKDFRARYVAKDFIEEPRFEVPKLAALIMLRYFWANIDDMELLYDLCFVFLNQFTSDFSFFRIFIEKEIIPNYSIEWRQNALKFVVKKFEDDLASAQNENIVKMLHYIIIPCLHYAFERYDVDLVVGTPANPDIPDDNNLVSLMCHKVMNRSKFQMSDSMLIALFHLGCLFVSNCPAHIHNSAQKKQGDRLRILMLLGWPCLSPQQQQDQTTRYMGHLLIAHIIDQFNIHRKIVLQVFHSLLRAYHTDPREVVKKSLDVLTPAMPKRVDDGCKQMMTFVKKTILEEGHNGPQVYHCLSLVVRHYKIYYNVRHYMIQFLMNAIHRLVTMQGSIENRRIAIDVCEMVIKWEQLRLKNLEEAGVTTEGNFDGTFEAVQGVPTATAAAVGLHRSSADSVSAATSLGHANLTAISRHDEEEVNKPIEKVYIDNVTTLLLKMAINVPDSTNAQQVAALEQLNKRSLGLLKACLKPNMWGYKATIRIQWLEKQLITSVDPAVLQQHRDSQNFLTHLSLQAQAIVDLYTQLVSMLPLEKMLLNMKQAQRGIVACLASQQTGVLRSSYQLIAKLMEKTKSTGEGLVELEIVNQFIAKYINDTFTNYEKNQAQPVTTIYPAINILRTMCASQPAYVDTVCLPSFLKAIQRLVKDHIASSTKGENKVVPALAELIIYSLELLRPRVHAMSAEARRNIALCILQPLVEKAQIDRVLEVVLKMVDELVKTGDEKQPNQGVPLLIRLTQAFESQNRHKTGGEMLLFLLKIVLYVYETPSLRSTDAVVKLSNAFHWGLSVQDEEIRNRFFKVFDAQVSRRVYERLYHIVALQNWGDMHDTYWIKHCINLMLLSVMEERKEIEIPYPAKLVNCATFWRSFEISFRLDALPSDASMEQSPDIYSVDPTSVQMDLSADVVPKDNDFSSTDDVRTMVQGAATTVASVEVTDLSSGEVDFTPEMLIKKQSDLLYAAARFRITDVIASIIELIHSDSDLASKVWIKLFTSLWKGLTTYERGSLEAEMMPFLVSGCHISQQNCSCSSLTTFMEAVYRCDPPVKFQPNVVKYVSANHHAWHRGIMLLENDVMSMPKMLRNDQILELFPSPYFMHQLATMDSLKELYEELDEEDQLEALWNWRAYYEGTTHAISLCSQGRYELALQYVSSLMDSTSEHLYAGVDCTGALTSALYAEYEEWQKIWVKSTRELGRWEDLRDFANSQSVQDLGLLAGSSWHIPEWDLFSECLAQLEGCTPPHLFFDVCLYKAMHLVIHPSLYEEESDKLKVRIKKLLEDCNDELMKKWERLPKVVSHSHINILQSANRVEEVGEASALSVNVLLANSRQAQHANILSEVKSLMKTWRNRTPTLADNYSHWMDIHHWRIHYFAAAVKLLRRWETFPSSQIQHTHMALHTAAVSEEQLARAARRCGLFGVAQESLNRLHTLPAVLPADADSRVTEHIKCLIKKASEFNATQLEEQTALREALAVTENVKLNVLNKEHVAKIFSLKGVVLSKLGRIEEANCAFSAAATLIEPSSVKNSVWSRWGEHLESVFFANSSEDSALDYGINALSCILEGARVDNEEKTRKYIAKFFWLLRCMSCHGEVVCSKMYAVVEKFACEIPPLNWLYWLPQLVSELRQRPSHAIAAIISYVAENFEQQTFCAIRSAMDPVEIDRAVREAFLGKQDLSLPSEGTFKEYMVKIVVQLCHFKPPDILALNRIFNELDAMDESWLERNILVANAFRDRMFKYIFSLENSSDVATVILPKDIETDICRWIQLLCSPENLCTDGAEFVRSCSESLAADLSFTSVSSRRVLRVITVLNNWILMLNSKLGDLPKKRMLQDVSPFLASYTCKVANVEVLGEVISSKTKQYSAYIARFMPIYHVVRRGGVLCRRITIRALNGKIYSYHFIKHSLNRRNYVLQFFSAANVLLDKDRETCRRFLQFVTRRTVYSGTFTLLECPNKNDAYYSFIDILNEVISNREQLRNAADIILKYYDMLADVRVPSTVSKYTDIYTRCSSPTMVASDMLSSWLHKRYDNPTHLFTLRKQLALQLSLLCISEYLFSLKAMMLEYMDLDLSTGQLSYADLDFNISSLGNSSEHVKIVPFRLTPNLVHFLGMSLEGHYKCATVAICHCFLQQNVTLFLKPLIWDVLADYSKDRELNARNLQENVYEIIASIQKRLFDFGGDPLRQVNELMRSAQSVENLARMDPCWHPWF